MASYDAGGYYDYDYGTATSAVGKEQHHAEDPYYSAYAVGAGLSDGSSAYSASPPPSSPSSSSSDDAFIHNGGGGGTTTTTTTTTSSSSDAYYYGHGHGHGHGQQHHYYYDGGSHHHRQQPRDGGYYGYDFDGSGIIDESSASSAVSASGVDLTDFIQDRFADAFDPIPLDRAVAQQAQTSGQLNAKHRELLELQAKAQSRLARSRARFQEGLQDAQEVRANLEWTSKKMASLKKKAEKKHPSEYKKARERYPSPEY